MAALPGCRGAAAAAAVEVCVYDAAAGAAALWLMGALWRRWLLAWLLWGAATLCTYGRHASAGAVGRGRDEGGAAAGRHKQGQKACHNIGAGGRPLLAVLLQVAVPLYCGLRAPWP
jgi:hypothetical protein